ncbi:M15 family metallopeptidase [Serpentinicella alkaliphila]|uniref:LAS superfamily LD-carboxypeptidase LdcB n=1 Tax=Serpentinicella alkaliphila TaxID=1734049 RepID=A0A4R2T9F9_9FIRM|nr:M15 family metallopeptidase [Serpentinicella alkaliphila]QUH26111.1 M15 family metallopeptidase [Serpentinicella alkaliphila]TCP98441.1 LAS superfamily LD-carboxypeptidase LdcB [Serpentinicella alkaliphila]
MYEYKKRNIVRVLGAAITTLAIFYTLSINLFANPLNHDKSEITVNLKPMGLFSVYSSNRFIESYNTIEYAMNTVNRINNPILKFNPANKKIYGADYPYIVYESNGNGQAFSNENKAYSFVLKTKNSYAIDEENNKLLYSNFDRLVKWNDDTKAGDLFLVNKWKPINSDYILEDFVNLTSKKNKYIQPRLDNMLIDKKAFGDLDKMAKDIYDSGITNMLITSTYRPYNTQSQIFKSRVDLNMRQNYSERNAMELAAMVVAKPGTSEHQTGLAIDVTVRDSYGNIHPLNQSFENTKVGKWVNENSWKYGYVVRYVDGKSDITGIIYEPWHLRYVGTPHAEVMYNMNYCLEEYLQYLASEKIISYKDYNGNLFNILYFESIYSTQLLSTLKQQKNIVSISGDGNCGVILTIN